MSDTTNSGEATETAGEEPAADAAADETDAPAKPKKRPGAHTDPFHSTN